MPKSLLLRTSFALVLLVGLPSSAQNTQHMQQENARLRAQIEALKAQCNGTSSRATNGWKQGNLSATVDAIRVGQRSNHPSQPDGHVTVALTLRNTGTLPIALNYQSGSFRLVDEAGGVYLATLKKVAGLSTATGHEADPSAVIDAGEIRSVMFNAFRVPSSTDTLPKRFDMNATFVQIEETAQGQVRKVRDYSIGFTDLPASNL